MKVPLRVKLAVMWSLNDRCSMLEDGVSVDSAADEVLADDGDSASRLVKSVLPGDLVAGGMAVAMSSTADVGFSQVSVKKSRSRLLSQISVMCFVSKRVFRSMHPSAECCVGGCGTVRV